MLLVGLLAECTWSPAIPGRQDQTECLFRVFVFTSPVLRPYATKRTHLSRQTSDTWRRVDAETNLLQPQIEQEKTNTVYFITWNWENEFCHQIAHLFPLTSKDPWILIYLLWIGSNGVKIGGWKWWKYGGWTPAAFKSHGYNHKKSWGEK